MAAFALSTNLYSFAQTRADPAFFGWPTATGEAEVIRQLGVGDMIIPKFAASAHYTADEGDVEWQQQYCAAIGVGYEAVVVEYEEVVAFGEGAVPFLLRVKGPLENDERPSGPPWVRVAIDVLPLDRPLSAKEFLLLRAVPPTLAAQFKGTVSRGRHLQEIPQSAVQAVRDAAAAEDRGPYLRQYSLVEASSPESAVEILNEADRPLREGDRAFLASAGGLLGVHDAISDSTLQPAGAPIPKRPDELIELLEEAKSKAVPGDQFAPSRVLAGATELKELLEGPLPVLPIDDFARFHDRYVLMASKVTQALEIAARSSTGPGEVVEPDDTEVETELDELAALQGLTIEAVRQTLPSEITLPDAVLAEAVTALRAGKHLLLGGPPGTGKSTLSEALSQAVVGNQFDVVTATADWSTFDTIGGYMPTVDGPLRFEPGVVLRGLQRGRWLTIDELNRADIDKAFGPLFTLLAGTGKDQLGRGIVLPFQGADGNSIEIRWAENRSSSSADYVLTPGWRLIGTLNLSDKATLFQLSFAFLRRFAVIDVPLPPRDDYESLFGGWCSEVKEEERQQIVEAAIDLAFGPRQLGPAILKDVATFMVRGLSETASGTSNYADSVTAFVTAVRLFAVPQYEGAEEEEAKAVLDIFSERWPERPVSTWQALEDALSSVVLS
jgi:MoxR-like ATPase